MPNGIEREVGFGDFDIIHKEARDADSPPEPQPATVEVPSAGGGVGSGKTNINITSWMGG